MTHNDLKQWMIQRREFLALCGVSLLPGLLGACGSAAPVQATPTTIATPTPSPTTTPRPTLTEADWTALAQKLPDGALVRPGSPRYATARQLFDPRFDSVQPAAVVYCASPADVQVCLAFAQRFSLPLTPRAGGHSSAGYSTTRGIIVDVTHMNAVKVNAGAATATIGAGARLIDVYATLAQQGFALPAGSCSTVGVAGLTLGGGHGVLGRKFGLTCDNLLAAQVVTADGRILDCDSRQNPDLFWALRGGGGGNFGVSTSFTFRIHPVSTLSLFTISWPWSSAASVFDAWQHWAPQGPDEIWSNCLFLTNSNKNGSPMVRVNGVYVGNMGQLNPLLQQLTGRINSAPTGRFVSNVSLLDGMLYEAGCYNRTVAQCHLPSQNPQGQLNRDTSAVKSDYFSQLLPAQGINALVKGIEKRQASPNLGEGGFGIDSYGGAINRVAPDATAFVHRNMLFSVQYSASWNASDPQSTVDANHSWLTQSWQSMRQYASGGAYQNYMDPDLPDWQHAYYGANLERLQRVKASYDPNNFFHFAQSISPAK